MRWRVIRESNGTVNEGRFQKDGVTRSMSSVHWLWMHLNHNQDAEEENSRYKEMSGVEDSSLPSWVRENSIEDRETPFREQHERAQQGLPPEEDEGMMEQISAIKRNRLRQQESASKLGEPVY